MTIKTSALGGGGLNIGDYTQSSRTSLPDGRVLLPADGRLISGGTYPLLEAALESRDKLFDVNSSESLTIQRSFCVQADGSKGWVGSTTNGEIREIDFTTGVTTIVHTYGGTGGYSSFACSDDGQNIYGLFIQTATDGYIAVYSNNGGSTWNNTTIHSVSIAVNPTTSEAAARGIIECDSSGVNLKAALAAGSSENQTVVYESNNSSAGWSEILTPRQSLTAPTSINEIVISRDLSTVGMLNLSSIANERWLSVGGGAFTDTYSTLPPLMGLNEADGVRRTVVSADGANFFMFHNATQQNGHFRVHTSVDNMATWQAAFVDAYKRSAAPANAIICAQFHPTDNNLVYIVVGNGATAATTQTEQSVILFNLTTGSSEVIATYQVRGLTLSSSLFTQVQSSIRINGSDVMLCISDGSSMDLAYIVKFKNGKYLADASDESIPYKVVADAP